MSLGRAIIHNVFGKKTNDFDEQIREDIQNLSNMLVNTKYNPETKKELVLLINENTKIFIEFTELLQKKVNLNERMIRILERVK